MTADKLTPLERRVFEAHNQLLDELGAEFSLARARVRQLEASAIEKMRHGSTETDQPLLALEKVFSEADDGSDVWCATIDQMISTSAESLDGIRAKARVACSLRLGDLDEVIVSSTAAQNETTLENSILRDLIRLYDPHLERKGAVRALIAK